MLDNEPCQEPRDKAFGHAMEEMEEHLQSVKYHWNLLEQRLGHAIRMALTPEEIDAARLFAMRAELGVHSAYLEGSALVHKANARRPQGKMEGPPLYDEGGECVGGFQEAARLLVLDNVLRSDIRCDKSDSGAVLARQYALAEELRDKWEAKHTPEPST